MKKTKDELISISRGGIVSKTTLTSKEADEIEELANSKRVNDFRHHNASYFDLRNRAWKVLLDSEINSLPIKLSEIAMRHSICLIDYESKEANTIDKERLRDTVEAFSVFFREKCFILYKNIANKKRLRFTVAHELGHVFLAHSKLTSIEYEKEANMFAARLLMPLFLIKELSLTTSDEISTAFDVTLSAAQNRLNRFNAIIPRNKFYTSELEKKLYIQFKDYIYNKT